MNEQLEKMYTSFMNNHVPNLWSNNAYPSLKTLGSWVKDLELRCDFIQVTQRNNSIKVENHNVHNFNCFSLLLFFIHSFIQTWIVNGTMLSFWLPGIFFPQGFLTGTLQVHARKYDLPIDELSFEFTVLQNYRDQSKYNEAIKNLEYGQQIDEDKQVFK